MLAPARSSSAAETRAGEQIDSHVSIGVDAAVFLHILHLCWVNMLNLLNSLGLARGSKWKTQRINYFTDLRRMVGERKKKEKRKNK